MPVAHREGCESVIVESEASRGIDRRSRRSVLRPAILKLWGRAVDANFLLLLSGNGARMVSTCDYTNLMACSPAGNIKWTLGQDRSYLATKDEVLTHFDHCLDVVKQRMPNISAGRSSRMTSPTGSSASPAHRRTANSWLARRGD